MYVLMWHGFISIAFYFVIRKRRPVPIRTSILVYTLLLFPKAMLEDKLSDQVKNTNASIFEKGYEYSQIEKYSYFYYFTKEDRPPNKKEMERFLKKRYKEFSDVAKKCEGVKYSSFTSLMCSSNQSLSYKYRDYASSIRIGEVLCGEVAIKRMASVDSESCGILQDAYISMGSFLKAEALALKVCLIHRDRFSCRYFLSANEGLSEEFRRFEIQRCNRVLNGCINYIFGRVASSLNLHGNNHLLELGKELCKNKMGDEILPESCSFLLHHLQLNEHIKNKDVVHATKTYEFLKSNVMNFLWAETYLKRVEYSIEKITKGEAAAKTFCYNNKRGPAKMNYLCRNEPYIER